MRSGTFHVDYSKRVRTLIETSDIRNKSKSRQTKSTSDWPLASFTLRAWPWPNGCCPSDLLRPLLRTMPGVEEEEPRPVIGRQATPTGRVESSKRRCHTAGEQAAPKGAEDLINSGPRERNRPPPEHQKPRLSQWLLVLSHLIETLHPVSAGEPLRLVWARCPNPSSI